MATQLGVNCVVNVALALPLSVTSDTISNTCSVAVPPQSAVARMITETCLVPLQLFVAIAVTVTDWPRVITALSTATLGVTQGVFNTTVP